MDFLYSITLLASLTAGSLALLAGFVALARTWLVATDDPEGSLTQRLCQAATTGALVSVVVAIVSIGIHLAFGHRPASAEGLGPIAFFAVHPAYLGAVATAAMATLSVRLIRVRLAQRTEGPCS